MATGDACDSQQAAFDGVWFGAPAQPGCPEQLRLSPSSTAIAVVAPRYALGQKMDLDPQFQRIASGGGFRANQVAFDGVGLFYIANQMLHFEKAGDAPGAVACRYLRENIR